MSYMKYRPITRILSLAAALFILTACTPHNLPDGWYTASGEGPDTRIGPSIVTCSDFAALHLDSLPSGEGTFIYQITGTVKPEKQKRWTAATRKAVGRHIVFLYEGNVLAAPRINMPIDRGTFAISAPAISGDADRMRELLNSAHLNIPAEIKRAKLIDSDCDRIMNEARQKAEAIIQDAETRAKRMLSEQAILQEAKKRALDMLTKAQNGSNDIKDAAEKYVAHLLEEAQDYFQNGLQEVQQTKNKIDGLKK